MRRQFSRITAGQGKVAPSGKLLTRGLLAAPHRVQHRDYPLLRPRRPVTAAAAQRRRAPPLWARSRQALELRPAQPRSRLFDRGDPRAAASGRWRQLHLRPGRTAGARSCARNPVQNCRFEKAATGVRDDGRAVHGRSRPRLPDHRRALRLRCSVAAAGAKALTARPAPDSPWEIVGLSFDASAARLTPAASLQFSRTYS